MLTVQRMPSILRKGTEVRRHGGSRVCNTAPSHPGSLKIEKGLEVEPGYNPQGLLMVAWVQQTDSKSHVPYSLKIVPPAGEQMSKHKADRSHPSHKNRLTQVNFRMNYKLLKVKFYLLEQIN